MTASLKGFGRRPLLARVSTRGVNAVEWARSATLEATAALLWQDEKTTRFPAPAGALCEFVRGPGGAGKRELSDARAPADGHFGTGRYPCSRAGRRPSS